MPFDYVLTEKRERLGIISINQPERMNALNLTALSELLQAISLFESDREVAAICFTGTGSRAFCAGLELSALRDLDPMAAYRFVRIGQSLTNRIESLNKPTIAAVNGLALGAGFEITLACDLVAAAEGAAFGFPEVRVGMIPAWGGTRRLTDILGRRKVKELVLTGALLTAEQALQADVINAVVPAGELLDKAAEWVEKMSAGGRVALWQAKKVLDREGGISQERAQDLEAECFSLCFSTTELSSKIDEYVSRRAAVPSQAPQLVTDTEEEGPEPEAEEAPVVEEEATAVEEEAPVVEEEAPVVEEEVKAAREGPSSFWADENEKAEEGPAGAVKPSSFEDEQSLLDDFFD